MSCVKAVGNTLLIAGWKSTSLIDVHGHVSFTLWLCGCNLKCPFCHNWRIANGDSSLCKPIEVERVIEEVVASKNLVDYLHVTGGEPLLQYENLAVLFERVKSMGIACSLNSNLTLTKELMHLARQGLVDHVATDLKVPPEILYGVPSVARNLWKSFIESLKVIRDFNIPLELRIPVHRKLTHNVLREYIEQVIGNVLVEKTVVVVNPLLSEPIVKPRDPSWCRENCTVNAERLQQISDLFKHYGFSRVVVKSIPGFEQ
ncbi:MAG: anaerobic ribonucleoside-triphosphate reductase activating protein [Desulfurococcaceae archaeon]